MANTGNLDLDLITNDGVFDIDRVDENMVKIDEAVGGKPSLLETIAKTIVGAINELFTNKLDKGVALKAANARVLEQQIENLNEEETMAVALDNGYGTMRAYRKGNFVRFQIGLNTIAYNKSVSQTPVVVGTIPSNFIPKASEYITCKVTIGDKYLRYQLKTDGTLEVSSVTGTVTIGNFLSSSLYYNLTYQANV